MKLHFSLLSFLIACGGESVIEKQQNSAPIIMIGSHSPDAEILEGYEETFRASVSDDNNTYDELMVAWYVGENIVCDWETVSPAGESFCDIVFSDEDNNVIAEVRDPDGAGGRAEIGVVIVPTDAPTAEILNPLQNTNHYSDQLILFSGVVGDAEDNPEDLIVTWTSSLDGELSVDTTPDSTGSISDYGYLSEGQHALELRVEDTSGKITKEQIIIQVGSANETPSCEILTPATQSAFLEGDDVLFEGMAQDANIESTELQIEFNSDRDGLLGNGTISSNGEVTFITNQLTNNAHVISMTVTDEVGAVCQDAVVVYVGTAPVTNIEEPLSGDVFSLGSDVYFHGTTSDGEDQMSDLVVEWTSNSAGVINTSTPDSQGSHQFTTNILTAGTHTITFSSTDTTGLVSTDTVTIQINTPPNAPTLSLSPDPITSSDVLTVNITSGGDDDGDPVTHNVEWFKNGTLQSNTGNSVPATDLTLGDIWMARVTPNDGYTDGTLSEVSIVVSNSLPTVTTPVITSSAGSMYNDATLTCSATALDADQTVIPTYSWTVNGNTYNGSTLDLSTTAAAVGDQITCSVSVTDNQGAMASDASNVTLINRSPVLSQVQINPTTPSSIDTLTCVPTSSDADGETLTTTYDWTISGNSVGSASTLNLTSISINPTDTVECMVTVEDPNGATDTMSGTTTIINTAPSISNLTLNPTEPTLSDTLSCMASVTDIDGETPTVTYTFTNLMSGTVYTPTTSSSTQATLNLASVTANFEDVIECSVTATDGYGGSTSDSTQVTIINTSPVFDTPATITPSTVEIGTAVTCSAVASDPDDGVSSLTYVWNINSVQVSTGPGWTVNSTDASVGDDISCTAIAVDYTGNSTTSTSTSITISNTAPVVSNVTLDNTSPYTNDTIGVSPTTFDFNGDTVTLQFEWHVIDASNGGTDTIVYTGNNPAFTNLDGSQSYGFDRDDEVYVVVTPNDGNDNGTSIESDHAFVLNSAPSAPIVAVTSTTNPPMEGVDDLTCAITSTSSDPDGDSIDYTYSWYDPNGATAQISPSTTSLTNVFPGGSTTPGLWECDVTASDGTATVSGSSDIEVDADWAGPLDFSNCGQTGRTGPSQSQCDSQYAGTTLDGLVTLNGGYQTWIVPSNGTYNIEVAGAAGGASSSYPAGYGAMMSGDFNLVAGDVLTIVVGHKGDTGGTSGGGGGGGGGTFVVLNQNIPLIIAGGGGGSHQNQGTDNAKGGSTGTTGLSNGSTGTGYRSGSGGGWFGDGANGDYSAQGGRGWNNGLVGGVYADVNSHWSRGDGGFGGGGGGCWPAGSGGGYNGGVSPNSGGNTTPGGSGGGSYNSGVNQVNTSDTNTGHGYVFIDKL